MEHLSRALLFLLLAVCPALRAAQQAQDPLPEVVQRWLATQTNVQSWRADVTQYRFLKALKAPLVSTGEVWFASPDRFRWQLGNPAQTIVLRKADVMTVVYPRLKRAERYKFSNAANSPWRDALKLLEAGFPRSARDLEQQFRIREIVATNNLQELRLEPRSAGARRMMPGVSVTFSTNDWLLHGTEIEFADGSRMRNLFSKGQTNAPVEDELFSAKLPPDYKVTEPFKPEP